MLARAILIAGAALLASCGEQAVTCNYRGEIIIPVDAAADDQARWQAENEALARRRFDMILAEKSGEPGPTLSYTKEMLEKAKSCP